MILKVEDLYGETIEWIRKYIKCVGNDPVLDVQESWDAISYDTMGIITQTEKYFLRIELYKEMVNILDEAPPKSGYTEVSEELGKYDVLVRKNLSTLNLGNAHQTFKDMKNFVAQVASQPRPQPAPVDNDEVTAIAENVNLIDPITKLRLTDPIKNLRCGHIYERQTIYDLLAKGSVKCPIPGCVAANQIMIDDLLPDIALKKYLSQHP